jgi:polysaccharide biosynthesis transport protein
MAPYRRLWTAVRRQRLIVGALVGLGTLASLGAAALMKPVYDAQSTVIISRGSVRDAAGRSTGPIRAQDLIGNESWLELLRSFTVLEPVVLDLQLFLVVKPEADWPRFAGMGVKSTALGGQYTLQVDTSGKTWTLTEKARGMVDSGAVGDSVGRREGMTWQLSDAVVTPGGTLRFSVIPPREAADELLKRHRVERQLTSDFLTLGLTDGNPEMAAKIVNRWTSSFVTAAGDLTRRNLSEFTLALREQLDVAAAHLKQSEIALENFRVTTITLPSENAPVAGGVEATRNPVFQAYFAQKVEYDALRRDREALERIVADAAENRGDYEALLSVPGVLSNAELLRNAVTDLVAREGELRQLRRTLTDENPQVRDMRDRITDLRQRSLPQLAAQSLVQLRRRETELARRIAGAATEMREIPTRTIEELRLRREVEVASALYTQLQQRFEEARLADAGSVANVRMVDPALVPRRPRSGRSAKLAGVGVIASLALAVLVAWARDRLDRRFRYPEQAVDDLGLAIVGAVPALSARRKGLQALVEQQQLIESFRSLALQVRGAVTPGTPFVVAILSGDAGDGKSLVASNLATTLASSGQRTLLLDADIRRGRLHDTYGVPLAPGLVDVLRTPSMSLADVVTATGTANLDLVTGGTRASGTPELLTGHRLADVLNEARAGYQCVVVDCAPLGAGVDAYAVAAAAGIALVIVRVGRTDRRLLDARLVSLDRLPVHVLGAVINGIDAERDPAYASYAYLQEYASTEPQLRSGNGTSLVRTPSQGPK